MRVFEATSNGEILKSWKKLFLSFFRWALMWQLMLRRILGKLLVTGQCGLCESIRKLRMCSEKNNYDASDSLTIRP